MKMHEGEVDIDEFLVKQLVAAQFLQFAKLPVHPIQSTGTVNTIYRLGDHFCVRFPLLESWARDIEKEWNWLPKLAPHLSLRIPEPVAKGQPTSEYPFPWAIYRWIEGHSYRDDLIQDERQAAADLAQFLIELRRIDSRDAPRTGRRPLRELDAVTCAAFEASQGVIDNAVALAWRSALKTPPWDGRPVWIHTDLLRSNLLVEGGRLRAVIDFGGIGVGDPAADVIAAWSVFNPIGRSVFRAALDVDDDAWNRARGYALHQAVLIVPYYAETNPGLVTLAKRTIKEILIDLEYTAFT
ncbi:aminoglycoside phosphotransferase family protein [Leptolyngbya sp. NIES-2104]|uniref:aminoglycoside phosphotransferase family protein n=1 Tax=Leptolyngbya sp. NIES-2104 TaxID=1552121 RepID=UPI0006EC8CE0|nr:aminoglycoside phosphotransferase family protein [Leptolyngbya sp. NIES-2104]GAP96614.1 putative phosphotransferase [Leptolyngbya sp. NIES-2104]